MSIQAVEWVTGKIVLDATFRDALLADPDRTLAEFELTESEIAWIKYIDFETMDSMAKMISLRLPEQPGKLKN